MKNSYSKTSPDVKEISGADASRLARFRRAYPLMWGWKNWLILAAPFFVVWLAFGAERLAIMLTAYFSTLVYCLRENARNNRRLDCLARKTREQGNA